MTDLTVTPPPATTLIVAPQVSTALTMDGGQGPAGPALVPRTYPIAITAPGQSVIPLPVPPVVPSSVRLIVNGLAYAVPDILADTTKVTWIDPDFILEPGDAVVLSYV